MKIIGLLGGMSWESSAEYYPNLAQIRGSLLTCQAWTTLGDEPTLWYDT